MGTMNDFRYFLGESIERAGTLVTTIGICLKPNSGLPGCHPDHFYDDEAWENLNRLRLSLAEAYEAKVFNVGREKMQTFLEIIEALTEGLFNSPPGFAGHFRGGGRHAREECSEKNPAWYPPPPGRAHRVLPDGSVRLWGRLRLLVDTAIPVLHRHHGGAEFSLVPSSQTSLGPLLKQLGFDGEEVAITVVRCPGASGREA